MGLPDGIKRSKIGLVRRLDTILAVTSDRRTDTLP